MYGHDECTHSLEAQFAELRDRVTFLEHEIKVLKLTPRKLIEARAWALIYELRSRAPVNGKTSMSSTDCADFLENGTNDTLKLGNSGNHQRIIIDTMDIVTELDYNIINEKIGPKGKKMWRLVLLPLRDEYTLKDLIADYR